jgi:hypothetical protein
MLPICCPHRNISLLPPQVPHLWKPLFEFPDLNVYLGEQGNYPVSNQQPLRTGSTGKTLHPQTLSPQAQDSGIMADSGAFSLCTQVVTPGGLWAPPNSTLKIHHQTHLDRATGEQRPPEQPFGGVLAWFQVGPEIQVRRKK